MSPQPKPHALYGLSLMRGVSVGGKSLKMDTLGIRHKVIKLELIQERLNNGSRLQGSKTLSKKSPRNQGSRPRVLMFFDGDSIHKVKNKEKWFLAKIISYSKARETLKKVLKLREKKLGFPP